MDTGDERRARYDRARELEARGDLPSAYARFLEVGALFDAARVMWGLGKPEESAALLARGGYFFDAASCYVQMGRDNEALEQFMRVAPEDPRYREAALSAMAAVIRLGRIDLRVLTFLSPFTLDAPRDGREAAALDAMAQLAARCGLYEVASAFRVRSMANRVPGPAPASTPATPPSDAGLSSVVEEERAFRSRKKRQSSEVVRGGAVPSATTTQSNVLVGEGSVVNSRYLLGKKLGRGGTATVYAATDLELKEQVAIKLFHHVLDDVETEARFRREVQLSRRLQHPNIVRVFDIGRYANHKYITMELLEGRDLRSILEERGTLAFAEGVELLMTACQCLAHAHGQEIVHRDVTPANFFITQSGTLKLMDFGIARDVNTAKVTETGIIMGTPAYICPEQILHFEQVRPSFDLYALGVVTYRMFTGREPFSGGSMEVLMHHVNTPPPSPRKLRSDMPQALEDVILKLLQKNPDDRFPTCDALREELGRLLPTLR
ncbi:MAG: protein kinase domain-containing protein [Myxococcota bacterium]